MVSLPAEQLCALPGGLPQPRQHRACGRQQAVFARRSGELAETRAEDEPAVQIARDHPVVLQGHCEPVSGGSSQTGGADQVRQRGGSRLEGRKHQGSLVEDADSTRVVHEPILPSQHAR